MTRFFLTAHALPNRLNLNLSDGAQVLASQLTNELRALFPNNAVELFVSYYDYYLPEAFNSASDTYIDKVSEVLAATRVFSRPFRDSPTTCGVSSLLVSRHRQPLAQQRCVDSSSLHLTRRLFSKTRSRLQFFP